MTRAKIAVVDDDPLIQDLLRDLLEEGGYRVRCWPVTLATFAALRATPPDLALLDVNPYSAPMGWALLERWCADEATKGIPVIVWSTNSDALTARLARLQALRCAVMAKPFDIDELLATIARLVAEQGVGGAER